MDKRLNVGIHTIYSSFFRPIRIDGISGSGVVSICSKDEFGNTLAQFQNINIGQNEIFSLPGIGAENSGQSVRVEVSEGSVCLHGSFPFEVGEWIHEYSA